jgi:uncharacterized protein YecT (DUF1311 family)
VKLTFIVLLSVLFLADPSHVYALDCTKASSPVEELICSTPELKSADEAMSAAYFKLLRETTDPDFHEALIRSQRRWLEVRSHSPDRFGQAESDTTDDRKVLLKMTRERLTSLRTAEPIHMLELQRNIASEDGGSTFSGYKTYCVLQPPPYGSWDYECWGDTLRQHNDRICSSVMEWASGHMTENRAVSILKNGEPKVVATCSTGYATTSEQCPEPDDDVWTKLDAHWNTAPDPSEPLPTSDVANLWKFDPDIDPSATDREWMHDCLFTSTYPPPQASRPSSKSGASGR